MSSAFEAGLEGVDKRYVKKDVDFSKYKKSMMDEVVFYFDRGADYKGIRRPLRSPGSRA